jgi:hypothetical protein
MTTTENHRQVIESCQADCAHVRQAVDERTIAEDQDGVWYIEFHRVPAEDGSLELTYGGGRWGRVSVTSAGASGCL